MKNQPHFLSALLPFLLMCSQPGATARLAGVAVLDRNYLTVTFVEGVVKFKEDGEDAPAPDAVSVESKDNWVVGFGTLDTKAVADPAGWRIASDDDPAYGRKGKAPAAVFRKAKINGMAQLEWDNAKRDFRYATPLLHTIYLKLPSPLGEGKKYRLEIGAKVDPGKPSVGFVFDPFRSVSEAVHVNLAGYEADRSVKSADLFHWLGDGGPRDYSAFEGAKVYLCNTATGERRETGTVKLWMARGGDIRGHDLTGSTVWTADFGPEVAPGTWRVAVEGVGCSQDFTVDRGIYGTPFKVSVKGFYYMRIGEPERPDIRPIPRQPPYIPGKAPADCKVLITTMHPYHPEWRTFAPGDKWDPPHAWDRFVKEGRPENPNAIGGHSDAADWDRHLGHVSIIYDMLYPFILTGGAIGDDDCGIAESGNGIPDILDEARNEVDFWLSLRDGAGYSHGVTNPTREHVFYQAANTVVAAWANAANASMLAECLRIAGLDNLRKQYQNEAAKAYKYASKQKDQQLDKGQGIGGPAMRGADFKMTAAAFLFSLTGEKQYEDAMKELSVAVDDHSDIIQRHACQIWGTAGYLLSPRKSRYPDLRERMRKCVIASALEKEVAYSAKRPSRRSSDNDDGYFHTCQNVQRTLLAHRITKDPAEKARFLDALVLEADWGLGRNPLNMIQMTTATTPLEKLRSVENAYTSGWKDGTPGVHPGHTPYLNADDWGRGMIMSRPTWMGERGYPAQKEWPRGEIYYNTRYVYAHSEFTPQQTMRGKTALYGYLYGIGK